MNMTTVSKPSELLTQCFETMLNLGLYYRTVPKKATKVLQMESIEFGKRGNKHYFLLPSHEKKNLSGHFCWVYRVRDNIK